MFFLQWFRWLDKNGRQQQMSVGLKFESIHILSSFFFIRISKNVSPVFIVNLMKGFIELRVSNNLFGSILSKSVLQWKKVITN